MDARASLRTDTGYGLRKMTVTQATRESNPSLRDDPAALAVLSLLGLLVVAPTGASREAGYVGSEVCRGCHAAEYSAWQGSHHDLAMQPANDKTVLGNFDDAVFEHRGVRSRFFRRDGHYLVETQGADGGQHEYQVAYSFGVDPLQQYLIGFPDGRYQALTVAWDSRPRAQGGQRWFHLYPNEDIPPGDELHWTAPAHNWNFACAECHSTHLRKNYDAASDTYRTSWSEINVACEACHGPGERHVAAATAASKVTEAGYPTDHGLAVELGGPGEWRFEADARTAHRTKPAGGAAEVELCGRCHARRSQLSEDYVHGKPLSDTHRVQMLTERYYHPDGQILDEVYVYGSFRQSRMHAAGVTCSDCHEPHSLKLRAEGSGVCTTCHAAPVYDSPAHHHHPDGSEGARCVECHMPERTYMVVDPRRDHSLRIPRPDLSLTLGVPNACTQCHSDRSDQWAANAVQHWYGKDRQPDQQAYAQVLHTAREGEAGAAQGLSAMVLDETLPAIVRATALYELAQWLQPQSLPAIQAGLAADDPLVRRAAVEAVQRIDIAARWQLVSPRLDDPVRGVRVAAAAALADVQLDDVDTSMRETLRQAFAEYVASEQLNADRAEHWTNLANFHFQQGKVEEAEKSFAESRRRSARFVPAYVNQADMYRALGWEAAGERILREGIEALPQAASIHHALGLLLIRTDRREAALKSLAQAYRLDPENPRFGYVYGIALDSAGQRDSAVEVWEAIVEQRPNEREVLNVLAMTLYQMGEHEGALHHAEQLAALSPGDPAPQRVVTAIRQALEHHR